MSDWDNRWRQVRVDKSGAEATAVRIEKLSTGGYLFHTREPTGEFDIWLESEADVVASLQDYVLEDSDPLSTDSAKS